MRKRDDKERNYLLQNRGEREKKKILLLKEGNPFCRREEEMAFENKSTKSDKFQNDRLHQFIKGVFKII